MELVEDRHGESVRLEQERLDWRWVTERLPYEPLPPLVTLVLLDFEGHGSPPLGEIITARGGRPIR